MKDKMKMKDHVAIAIADTDVTLMNWLIYEIERALRPDIAVSVMDYGFENLFVEEDIAKKLINPIGGIEINPHEEQCIVRYSMVGPEPKPDEEEATFPLPSTLNDRIRNAATNLGVLGINHLIVLGGLKGLERARQLKEGLKDKPDLKIYFVPMNMDGNMGYKSADRMTPIHSVGYPSAAVDLYKKTIRYGKHVHNKTRALCMTVLGGGDGYVAAAAAAGQGMMIIPETEKDVREHFDDFLKRAEHYLSQNKKLVITVAERSILPHDTTSSYVAQFGEQADGQGDKYAVDSKLWELVKKKQSGHGITEGNYLAEIMNRHFRRTGSSYRVRDGDYDYGSRIAEGIDFDRWIARVYAGRIADAVRNGQNSGVMGVELETPFDDLKGRARLYTMDEIGRAPFPKEKFFNEKGWTVTQSFKELVCSFMDVKLPENGG